MDVTPYRRTETLTIDAPAEVLYDLVSDISRMGEWSPVATGGTYDDDGVWFTGDNAIGDGTWSTRCQVVVADRGREFTFVNHGVSGDYEMVRWGFVLRSSSPTRTEVTQSWEVLPTYADSFYAENGHDEDNLRALLDMMRGMAESSMPETLAALGEVAEQTGSEGSA